MYLFFDRTEDSQQAGRAFIERQGRRAAGRDPNSTDQGWPRIAAIVDWGVKPTPEAVMRPQRIIQPVLVVNGRNDVMVPTVNLYALFQQLPNARLTLHPNSGHGALFQYADAFVRDGLEFLAA